MNLQMLGEMVRAGEALLTNLTPVRKDVFVRTGTAMKRTHAYTTDMHRIHTRPILHITCVCYTDEGREKPIAVRTVEPLPYVHVLSTSMTSL